MQTWFWDGWRYLIDAFKDWKDFAPREAVIDAVRAVGRKAWVVLGVLFALSLVRSFVVPPIFGAEWYDDLIAWIMSRSRTQPYLYATNVVFFLISWSTIAMLLAIFLARAGAATSERPLEFGRHLLPVIVGLVLGTRVVTRLLLTVPHFGLREVIVPFAAGRHPGMEDDVFFLVKVINELLAHAQTFSWPAMQALLLVSVSVLFRSRVKTAAAVIIVLYLMMYLGPWNWLIMLAIRWEPLDQFLYGDSQFYRFNRIGAIHLVLNLALLGPLVAVYAAAWRRRSVSNGNGPG